MTNQSENLSEVDKSNKSTVAESVEQLISYSGEFNEDLEDYFLKHCGKERYDYNVVSIVGCQSSGKSTLMNGLFGTNFEVMNAMLGRSQTTKGLWCSFDSVGSIQTGKPTLIIDVEGTDSKERGEDRGSFEHKASLFALAMSDMVIMNMWYTDLGRYTASNYGLIRTVLQVNLELFHENKSDKKTTLLFIIRDYNDRISPMDSLEAMILTDVRNLWNDIYKPPGQEEALVTDFFKFQFWGLSSYFADETKFLEGVNTLRSKWNSDWRNELYIQNIPYGDIYLYMQSVWSTIQDASQLDIPSQKRLIAEHRCREMELNASIHLESMISLFDCDKENSDEMDEMFAVPFTGLKGMLQECINDTMALFDSNGVRYDPAVFQEVRLSLIDKVSRILQNMLNSNLDRDHKKLLDTAKVDLMEATDLLMVSEGGPEEMPNQSLILTFAERLDVWENELNDAVSERYSLSATIPAIADTIKDSKTLLSKHPEWRNSTKWTYNVEDLVKRVSEFANVQRRETHDRAFKGFCKRVGSSVTAIWASEGTREVITNPKLKSDAFWNALNEVLIIFEKSFSVKYQSFFDAYNEFYSNSDRPVISAGAFLYNNYRQYLGTLATDTFRMNELIDERFQKMFTDDDKGVPRKWTDYTPEAITAIYKDAKSSTFVLLEELGGPCFLCCGPDDQDAINYLLQIAGISDPVNPLLFGKVKGEIERNAENKMKRSYMDAIERNELKSVGAIPWWYWLLLLMFSYNEIIYVATSPLVLMTALILLIATGVAISSGNADGIRTNVLGGITILAGCALPLLSKLANASTSAATEKERKDQ